MRPLILYLVQLAQASKAGWPKPRLIFLGQYWVVEGVVGLSMILSLKERMHLEHIQVTGEIFAGWCSSLPIMTGPAGERLDVFNNELPSVVLLTVPCTTFSLWMSLSCLRIILSQPGTHRLCWCLGKWREEGGICIIHLASLQSVCFYDLLGRVADGQVTLSMMHDMVLPKPQYDRPSYQTKHDVHLRVAGEWGGRGQYDMIHSEWLHYWEQ